MKTPPLKSGLELDVWKQLIKKKHLKVRYESEVLPYLVERQYNPDFIITRRNGSKIYIECKGYFSPEDRTKMSWVLKNHPDKDIRMLFDKNNKISTRKNGSVYRYSDWCERRGVPYAFKTVPKEWLR